MIIISRFSKKENIFSGNDKYAGCVSRDKEASISQQGANGRTSSQNPILYSVPSLDRIAGTIKDERYKLRKELKEIHPNHSPWLEDSEKFLQNFYDSNGVTKFQYEQRKRKDKPGLLSPLSQIICHDVTDNDQDYFIERGMGDSLSIIEIALDLFPSPTSGCFELMGLIPDGMCLRFASGKSFKCFQGRDKSTLYFQHQGNIRKGPKGARLYENPKEGPSEFVRLEMEWHRRLIRKLGLSLPLSPDTVFSLGYSILDYFEFRQHCDFYRLAERLAKDKKEQYRHRRGRIDSYKLYREVLRHHVEYLINQEYVRAEGKVPNVWNPYDWRPAVAGQIDNLKAEFPELARHLDYFFPKWTGRKEQLRQWLKNAQEEE